MTILRLLLIGAATATIAASADHSPERLLADEALLRDPMALTLAKGRHSMVHRGEPGKSMFNLHSYLQHFEGKFFAMWTSAKVGEADPDEAIRYATSSDGHTWSAPGSLVDDLDGPEGPLRWIARGLYVEGGKLFALAALVGSERYGERGKNVVWDGLELRRFEWSGGKWVARGMYANDCMSNFPPMRIAGLFLMACRDKNMAMYFATTDAPAQGWKHIELAQDPPFHRLDEPSIHVAADGTVHAVIRDNSRSGFLARAISKDSGKTWSAPVRTNYPDATSKLFIGRLSTGGYYLVNNPNQKGRDPLAISFSEDGWTFGRSLAVRKQAPPLRAAGRAKPSRSFQYPHAMEQGGSLWVIYATNKEDIEISELPLAELGVR